MGPAGKGHSDSGVLQYGSLRVKLRRDGAGWERSFRLGGIAV
jgi:hypothetical protein